MVANFPKWKKKALSTQMCIFKPNMQNASAHFARNDVKWERNSAKYPHPFSSQKETYFHFKIHPLIITIMKETEGRRESHQPFFSPSSCSIFPPRTNFLNITTENIRCRKTITDEIRRQIFCFEREKRENFRNLKIDESESEWRYRIRVCAN